MPQEENNKAVIKRGGFKPSTQKNGKNYLFVIGIDKYVHCPTLYNAVKDAKDIVAVLQQRFRFEQENIKTLYNQAATKHNIYKAFEFFAETVTPTDNFLLYFSGHGEFKKLFNLGYWIPVEAERDATHKFIPNSEVKNILSAIKSHHTFLMADSCFSGSLFAKGTNKNISLRKERDPSRWGLTAGRNEIVTDGQPGGNSPFAESILYQLRNADSPLGVAELCNKTLEVVAANADQTPRGEPLKIEGHKGGQFVFHLRMDEAADWKNALAVNTVTAFQSFITKYPDSKKVEIAQGKIKAIKGELLWQKIEQARDGNLNEVSNKLRLVNQYVDHYEDQVHHDAALDIGELLDYKKQFFRAQNSEYALRRFLKQAAPTVKGTTLIKKTAQERLNNWNEQSLEMEAPSEIIPPTKKKVVEQPISKPTPKLKPVKPSPKQAYFFEKYGKYLLLLLIPILGYGIYNVIDKKGCDITQGNKPEILDNSSENTVDSSGTFKDTRDGQTYQWVRLKDGKKWMAQNLNYKTVDSWWYDNERSNGDKYGRLYTWQAAKQACPKGWQLPTDNDWWKMTSYYGKAINKAGGQEINRGSNAGREAYKVLIKDGSTKFSAIHGGFRKPDGEFGYFGGGNYWSSTEKDSLKAWHYTFQQNSYLIRSIDPKKWGFSCRCRQD